MQHGVKRVKLETSHFQRHTERVIHLSVDYTVYKSSGVTADAGIQVNGQAGDRVDDEDEDNDGRDYDDDCMPDGRVDNAAHAAVDEDNDYIS